MFETRSEAWERAGLSVSDVSETAVRRAQIEAVVLLPLLVGVVIAYNHQKQILGPGHQTVARIVTILALMLLGWALARDVGRAAGPSFMRRMDPATAGTVGFLMRLVTIAITLLVGLRIVGVHAQTLAVGGAFTAVILGLAAQQTLGNVFAGMVLLTARPFRVGERVRLQAGVVGGTAEGTVSQLGLLYTTLTRGYDRMLIPNNVVLAAAIVPLKEPDSVDVKVRLSSGVRPTQVQAILDNDVTTPTRSKATVLLEEVDGDEVVVRVQATPELAHDGARLADEIIGALSAVTGEHESVPRQPSETPGHPSSRTSETPEHPSSRTSETTEPPSSRTSETTEDPPGPPEAETRAHPTSVPGDHQDGATESPSFRRSPTRVHEEPAFGGFRRDAPEQRLRIGCRR